jgi:hypothetical protein
LMQGFSPGTSPPPVKIPIRTSRSLVVAAVFVREAYLSRAL